MNLGLDEVSIEIDPNGVAKLFVENYLALATDGVDPEKDFELPIFFMYSADPGTVIANDWVTVEHVVKYASLWFAQYDQADVATRMKLFHNLLTVDQHNFTITVVLLVLACREYLKLHSEHDDVVCDIVGKHLEDNNIVNENAQALVKLTQVITKFVYDTDGKPKP